MDGLNVSEAAGQTGWSPRMLRYLEQVGLIVPPRTPAGYRKYGLRELNELRMLTELRTRFHLQISDLVFAARLRRESELLAGELAPGSFDGCNGFMSPPLALHVLSKDFFRQETTIAQLAITPMPVCRAHNKK